MTDPMIDRPDPTFVTETRRRVAGAPKSPRHAAVVVPHTATPGQRVQRSAGQGGGTLILVDLWRDFGWFHSASWGEQRWVTVTAAVYFAMSVMQNLVNWASSREKG